MSERRQFPELNFDAVPGEIIAVDRPTPAHQAVLRALVHVCGSGFECDATVARLAEVAAVSGRTVTFALGFFARKGRIEIVRDPTARASGRRIHLLWRRPRRRGHEATTDVGGATFAPPPAQPLRPGGATSAPGGRNQCAAPAQPLRPSPIRQSRSSEKPESDPACAGTDGSDLGRRRPEPGPPTPPEVPPIAAAPPGPTPDPTPAPTPTVPDWRCAPRPAPAPPARRRRHIAGTIEPADFDRLLAEGDPIILAEWRRRREAPPPPELPPPTTPAPELLRLLTTHPLRAQIVPQAARALVVTLGDTEGSFSAWEKYCAEIARGDRHPDSIAVPIELATDARARGEPIDHLGRYVYRGMANWDRERGPTAARGPGPGLSTKIPPGPVAGSVRRST